MLYLPEIIKLDLQTKTFTFHSRLPDFIVAPCEVTVTYHAEAKDDFYLMHLKVQGNLLVLCQRCMQEFPFPYDNETVIAVFRSDERAEQMLEHYECIVSSNGKVDLEELVIDELHLYAPQCHPEINDCDSEINQFLAGKNESY